MRLSHCEATPGSRTALVIAASVQQPATVGRKSFELAHDSVVNKKQPAQKDIVVPTLLVTKDNVGAMAQKLIKTACIN